MPKTKLSTTVEVRDEQLRRDPIFREYWERTALARAVAIAVVRYRSQHGLTQTKLASKLGIRQPHVARLELGEHNPSMEMLQRLSRCLGLRFVIEVLPSDADRAEAITLPAGVDVVEDLTTSDGGRVLVAAG